MVNSTNRNATLVEKRIGQLKHLLKSFSFFTSDSRATDLFEISYMCRLVEFTIMSRPLFACQGKIFSLQNINSLFLDKGRLVSAGFDGIEVPGVKMGLGCWAWDGIGMLDLGWVGHLVLSLNALVQE